ncbi:MAG: heparan-alpha-glucosaminide N-acetyltransferase domain-containing protein, partial [Candidatus Hermodarchaeota archaeon]
MKYKNNTLEDIISFYNHSKVHIFIWKKNKIEPTISKIEWIIFNLVNKNRMDDSSLQTNNQIISNDLNPINFRFKDFDLARGIAIIFMILQHSFWVFGKYPTSNFFDSIMIEIAIVLGGFSAPVFMTLMGVFFGFKQENSVKYGLTRGLKLICLGYVLNIFRFVIPFSIGTELMSFHYPVLFEGFSAPIWEFFRLDILQFAGLALIILTLIEKYCREKELFSFIIAMLAIFLALFGGFFITNSPLDFFLGYFWSNSYSGFPLFPILFYPIIGLIIGK